MFKAWGTSQDCIYLIQRESLDLQGNRDQLKWK